MSTVNRKQLHYTKYHKSHTHTLITLLNQEIKINFMTTYSSNKDFHEVMSSKMPCKIPARESRFARVLEPDEAPWEGKLSVADLGLGVPREEDMFVGLKVLDGQHKRPRAISYSAEEGDEGCIVRWQSFTAKKEGHVSPVWGHPFLADECTAVPKM